MTHEQHPPAPSIPSDGAPNRLKSPPAWTWIMFGAVGILLVIILLISKSCGDNEGTGEESNRSAAASVARQPRPCEQPWSFRTVKVPKEGLPVYLCQGWRGYPIGGAVTYTSESGQVWKDQPGVITHFGWMPDGLYTVRADPEGSERQVQIFNRW